MDRNISEALDSFEKKVSNLINECSLESMSDTPDFILASYIRRCLEAYNEALRNRVKWYGRPISHSCNNNNTCNCKERIYIMKEMS